MVRLPAGDGTPGRIKVSWGGWCVEFKAKDQMKLPAVLYMTLICDVILLYEHRQLS